MAGQVRNGRTGTDIEDEGQRRVEGEEPRWTIRRRAVVDIVSSGM